MKRFFSQSIFCWRYAAQLVIAGMLLGNSALTQAALRCIENDTQITSTLDAALASADAVEDVRIKTGVYYFNSGAIGYFGVLQGTNKSLVISGGWSGNPGQCTTQAGPSTLTVFWGNNQRQVFGINASGTFTGNLKIENMTFGGGFSNSISSTACLSLGEQTGGVMGIVLDRVWIEGCTSSVNFSNPVVQVTSSATLVVRNSVFAFNNSGIDAPVILGLKGGTGYVLNNTIAINTSANTSGYAGLFMSTSNGATVTMANNLFDGNIATANSRVDVRLTSTGVSLQNNRLTGLSGTPAAEVGRTTGSAGFSGNSYNLSASSTARDAGAFFATLVQGSLDAEGQRRVQGTAVDLGALEYPLLFQNGFESP
jgi:hypothetical protein